MNSHFDRRDTGLAEYDYPAFRKVAPVVRHLTIAELAVMRGLVPIPDAVLDAYCADQIDAHPPSRFAVDQAFVGNVFAAWFVACTMLSGVAGIILGLRAGLDAASLCFLAGACCMVGGIASIGLLLLSSFLRFRGRAHWQTQEFRSFDEMPDVLPLPILTAAARMKDCSFVIGTLVQDRVMLDPYLRAYRHGSSICLGIWDGDTVIACALPPLASAPFSSPAATPGPPCAA